MRNLKFILSAAAILLAGALAAGLVARVVTAPRTGDVLSAGVLPVPSVLGQAADEVLFYPWSLYDMQDLAPISDAEIGGDAVGGNSTSVAVMDALGADFDMEALIRSQGTNRQEGAVNKQETVYVKDHPAVLPDGNTPVLLNYARSGNPRSVSWLMIPQEGVEPSEERRQAALDKVKGDLAQLSNATRSGILTTT